MTPLYILLALVISTKCQTIDIQSSELMDQSATVSSTEQLSDYVSVTGAVSDYQTIYATSSDQATTSISPTISSSQGSSVDTLTSMLLTTSYNLINQTTVSAPSSVDAFTSVMLATSYNLINQTTVSAPSSVQVTNIASSVIANEEPVNVTQAPTSSLVNFATVTSNVSTTTAPTSSLVNFATVTSNDSTTKAPTSSLVNSATKTSNVNTVINSTTINPTSMVIYVTSTTVTDTLEFSNLDLRPVLVKASFKLTDTWDALLASTNSQPYNQMKKKVLDGFDALYANDSAYLNTTLTNFTEGSINVNVIINFKPETTAQSAQEKITMIITAVDQNTFVGLTTVSNSSKVVLVTNGVWSPWSDVTGKCESALKNQTRVCTPPTEGGDPCIGSNTRIIPCVSFLSGSALFAPHSILSLIFITSTIFFS